MFAGSTQLFFTSNLRWVCRNTINAHGFSDHGFAESFIAENNLRIHIAEQGGLITDPCGAPTVVFEQKKACRIEGRRTLDNLSKSVSDPQGRSYRGINFFEINDLKFIQALVRGEHNISGFTNRILQRYLPGWTSSRISRMIHSFKAHRLIKRVKQTYKYYLTKRAKSLLFAHLQLTNRVIIPALAK